LGTEFDYKFFESEAGPFGKKLVEDNLAVFETSDGAVIYKGEQDGLHTRVFINSEGLPTYEAKELGLAKIKYDKYPYDFSVVVTGNEIVEYFKVLKAVMKKIFPELEKKTRHVPHGMLRLPSGKMSSRTGDVITGESLIEAVKEKIKDKVKDSDLPEEVIEQIAVGAIKYSILKQDSSRDIIFDFDKSLSFEGNSGPYLQYTFARTQSVLIKARENNIAPEVKTGEVLGEVEKLLARFPEVVYRAGEFLAPHFIATYLIELASAFNAFYANNKIVSEEENSAYRVALTAAVGQVLKNGLDLLGIATPAKM
jgi:arginyl-tRNA synthetase